MKPAIAILFNTVFAATLSAFSFVELTELGHIAYDRGDYREALKHLKMAKELAGNESSDNAAIAASNLAALDLTLGRSAPAVAGYREAVRLLEPRGEQDPRYRLSLSQLADALHQRGEFAEARQVLNRLASIIGRDAAPETNALTRLRMSEARTEVAAGQYGKAEEIYRHVLANSPTNSAIRAAALDGLGEAYLTKGKLAIAETAFREAHSIWNLLGQSARAASTCNRLGSRWLSDRKPRRALPYLHRALAVFEEKGINGVHLVSTLNNLGQAYRFAGDAQKALHYYGRAVETAKRDLGADHSMVAAVELNMGDFAMTRKKYVEAEHHLRQALLIDQRRLGSDHPAVARDLAWLATLHLLQKQRSAASEEFGAALAALDRSGVPFTPEHARWIELRAALLRENENYAEAAKLDAKAMRIRVKLVTQ